MKSLEPYQEPGVARRKGLQIQRIHTLNREHPTVCRSCGAYIGPNQEVVRTYGSSGRQKRRRSYHPRCYLDAHGEPVYD